MDPIERMRRTIAGEAADRVPVIPLMIRRPIKLEGLPFDECAREPRLLVQAHVKAWETYGYDGFHVTCDNWIPPAAMGCLIRFFPDQPPTVAARGLANTKNLKRLVRPRSGSEGRMGFKVECHRVSLPGR
jgi:uroporphyrinogen-III decarboxylase